MVVGESLTRLGDVQNRIVVGQRSPQVGGCAVSNTGAMWTLSPTEVEQALPQAQAGMLKRGEGIYVMLKSEATPAEIGRIKPVTLQ
jgi:hypothetical protein